MFSLIHDELDEAEKDKLAWHFILIAKYSINLDFLTSEYALHHHDSPKFKQYLTFLEELKHKQNSIIYKYFKKSDYGKTTD